MRRGYPDFLPEDVALVDFATLRRNLKSRHFPGRNPREDETVAASIADALAAAAPGKSRRGRLALNTFLGGSVPGATVLPVPGMEAAVVVNNRDHLSIQGYAGGIELKRAFATADALESALSKHLDFAWDPEIGYLTASPDDVGTGLCAGAVLHLEGLYLIGELDAVLRGLDAMRVEAVGVNAGGLRNIAHVFRLSNEITLGKTEQEIVAFSERAILATIEQEFNARVRLVEEMPRVFADSLMRALCILRGARLLSVAETADLVSPVRLAATMGFLDGITVGECDELMSARDFGETDEESDESDPDARDRVDGARADRMNARFAAVATNRKYAKLFP